MPPSDQKGECLGWRGQWKAKPMNPYWKRFIEEVTWCAEPHMTAVVGPSEAPGSWAPKSEDFARLFPELNRLLETAHIARAVVSDRPYQFFT